jgi:hypothetical protein
MDKFRNSVTLNPAVLLCVDRLCCELLVGVGVFWNPKCSGTPTIQTDVNPNWLTAPLIGKASSQKNVKKKIFLILALNVNSFETCHYVLLDLPLWAVREAVRLPLAPSSACRLTSVGSRRCLYIYTFAPINLFSKSCYFKIRSCYKYSIPNDSIALTRLCFNSFGVSKLCCQWQHSIVLQKQK